MRANLLCSYCSDVVIKSCHKESRNILFRFRLWWGVSSWVKSICKEKETASFTTLVEIQFSLRVTAFRQRQPGFWCIMLLHINSNLLFVHYTCPAIMFKCSYASSDCQNCLAGMACATPPGFIALAESLGAVNLKKWETDLKSSAFFWSVWCPFGEKRVIIEH